MSEIRAAGGTAEAVPADLTDPTTAAGVVDAAVGEVRRAGRAGELRRGLQFRRVRHLDARRSSAG